MGRVMNCTAALSDRQSPATRVSGGRALFVEDGKLLQSFGRSDEYHDYFSALRLRHKAKRRLMEELDRLETRQRNPGP